MAKPYLSIIIPAYNEAKRLPLTLIDIDRHLSQQEYSYEILVINDGSTDATAEIVDRFIPLIANLKIINLPKNQGKGAAVRSGMLSSKGNWRLFMDADNSTSIDEFSKIMPYLKDFDVIIGSRAVKGAKLHPPQPLYKQILGKLGNRFIQLLLLWGIWDSQCGFKCFSEETAEKIFSLTKINRWGFDIEALVLAKILGYRIKEVPIRWVNNPQSHVKTLDYLQTLWETIKIWWWLKRNKYNYERTIFNS